MTLLSRPLVSVHTVGSFQENCYLLVSDGELAVFDPGAEADRLMAAIDATGATVKYVILTHAHLDHVGACADLCARYRVPLYVPRGETELLAALPLQCATLGMPPQTPPVPDHLVDDHQVLNLGSGTITAIATPGHSAGGMSYRFGDCLFVGDTIFAGSVGRTDLWGASWAVLKAAIETRIFPLEDDLVMYPGHGPATTVGIERRTNPFFT